VRRRREKRDVCCAKGGGEKAIRFVTPEGNSGIASQEWVGDILSLNLSKKKKGGSFPL